MIIDAHQHFWTYDPVRHDWINEDMKIIRRDFQPEDLRQVYAQNQIHACVAVQADQTETETNTLLQHAAENDFMAGVVGWVDLRRPDLDGRLQHYAQFETLKGFRHVLQNEEPAFMLHPDFLRGIGQLQGYGFTYDILIYPQHLPAAIEMAAKFPEQRFVLDHLAKPVIRRNEIDDWKHNLQLLAQHPNMYCKISGLVTEADWNSWTEDQLRPYLDAVVEIFGPDRLMYGSDWPVCLVASSYARWYQGLRAYFSGFSSEDQEKIFGRTADVFYKLNRFN